MAINYTTKYAAKVAERFHLGSLTDSACGHDYDFVGAKTVKVYSVDTVALNDFDRTAGANRFGAVANLGDTVQEMTCAEDKGFTFAIDAGDMSDQAIDKAAGKALRREIDEVINPTVDKHRLAKWAEGAGNQYTPSAKPTKNTILGELIEANAMATEDLVPTEGRTLFISVDWYKLLVQADAVVALEKLGEQAVSKGAVGMVDGMIVKPVPTSWMPAGVGAIIKYKNCTADPVKLQNYDVLTKVQGFDGPVVQGRIYYDSFVLDAKKDGIVAIKTV
jgi:hypothetical protein